MAETVSQVIANARKRKSDMPVATALRYFQLIYGEVSLIRKQKFSHDISINLVAGQREYPLDPAYIRVESAAYDTDGTAAGRKLLTPITSEQLYIDNEGWRFEPVGIPEFFLIHPGSQAVPLWMIGFYPTPKYSTVALQFPRVTLAAAMMATFQLTDTVPQICIDNQVFVEGMLYNWDKDTNQANMASSYSLYKMELEKVAIYWDNKNVQIRPSIEVGHPGRNVPVAE